MPDAGDFDKRGASASPVSWGDAFAALPQETPDAGGLQRLQARLPAANTPRVHRRWPLWLAAAATLALVVALPLRISRETVIDQPATASAQQLVTLLRRRQIGQRIEHQHAVRQPTPDQRRQHHRQGRHQP